MTAAPSTRRLTLEGAPLMTIIGAPEEAPAPSSAVVVSRFAWIRRAADGLVAETARSPAVAELHDPRAAAVWFALATPRALDAGLAAETGLPAAALSELVAALHAARLVVDAGQAATELAAPLALWEFHDLLFHARSRPGRSLRAHGGTYRFLDHIEPIPAVPPDRWPSTVALPVPEYDRLEREDPSLTAVQARRSSIRTYGSEPLSAEQLGEFLYRVGRVEDLWELPMAGVASGSSDFVAKPYPSGGAAYELELYVAVQACQGLDPGLYHYASDRHHLARLPTGAAELDELYRRSAAAMGVAADSLQVVVVLTSRFSRVAWKYESIAYALVLKHVGVLMQTMYLAATAMQLAPCAIGTGDSDQFARATGIDPDAEPAVGEFALGSRPAQPD